MNFLLHDVGDGLFLENITDEDRLVTDFGSFNAIPRKLLAEINKPFYANNAFLLSHFHEDHYKGLVDLLKHRGHTYFNTIYFPYFMQNDDTTTLALAFFAMARFTIGTISGSMENDFVQLMQQINRRPYFIHTLYRGQSFNAGSQQYTVAWPPSTVDEHTHSRVRQVLHQFEQVRELYPELQNIYTALREQQDYYQNIDYQGKWYDSNLQQERDEREAFYPSIAKASEEAELQQRRQQLDPMLEHMQEALRSIANRLSLSYFNDHVCFLGDLEAEELQQCVQYIRQHKTSPFEVIVLPHHGTHWHDQMELLHAPIGLASNGTRMIKYWEKNNKRICELNWLTQASGSVLLTRHSQGWRIGRYHYPFPLTM